MLGSPTHPRAPRYELSPPWAAALHPDFAEGCSGFSQLPTGAPRSEGFDRFSSPSPTTPSSIQGDKTPRASACRFCGG
jgi:hypothetical protein